MTLYQFDPVPQSTVQPLRAQYLQQVGPLDGMWLTFAEMARAYMISRAGTAIGYCAVDSEQKLLQFHVVDSRESQAAFSEALAGLKISGAVAATSESAYLALCSDHQTSMAVNALMYRHEQESPPQVLGLPTSAFFSVVEVSALAAAVDFGCQALGAPREWLEGYYADLVSRGELFGLWLADTLIATGECRPSVMQPPYADIGVVVAREHRGHGVASDVLRRLLVHCADNDLRPICSTERDNLAAQGAIARAGFVSRDRIVEFEFAEPRGRDSRAEPPAADPQV